MCETAWKLLLKNILNGLNVGFILKYHLLYGKPFYVRNIMQVKSKLTYQKFMGSYNLDLTGAKTS
jgi:hypothetical protein